MFPPTLKVSFITDAPDTLRVFPNVDEPPTLKVEDIVVVVN